MKYHDHKQIQRYVSGQAGADEVAALQAALNESAELRALYLDYINLDEALGAAAGAATGMEDEPGVPDAASSSSAATSAHYWRWFAVAAAACVAAVMVERLVGLRQAARARSDIAAACSLTQEAITRLAVKPPPAIPAWVSPTDLLLEEPPVLKGDQSS